MLVAPFSYRHCFARKPTAYWTRNRSRLPHFLGMAQRQSLSLSPFDGHKPAICHKNKCFTLINSWGIGIYCRVIAFIGTGRQGRASGIPKTYGIPRLRRPANKSSLQGCQLDEKKPARLNAGLEEETKWLFIGQGASKPDSTWFSVSRLPSLAGFTGKMPKLILSK